MNINMKILLMILLVLSISISGCLDEDIKNSRAQAIDNGRINLCKKFENNTIIEKIEGTGYIENMFIVGRIKNIDTLIIQKTFSNDRILTTIEWEDGVVINMNYQIDQYIKNEVYVYDGMWTYNLIKCSDIIQEE